MCGITGVIAPGGRALKTQYFKAMCDVIAHRGPDDAGYFLGNDKKTTYLADSQFRQLSPDLPVIDSQEGEAILGKEKWQIFLGHRRLSILDPTPAGHQPMCDDQEDIVVVYNGEIYNFQELKKELELLGFRFKTHTDTEVLIYAYKAWGIAAINRFNGMFAFALWDRKQNIIFLARDRYGIKPFYYTQLADGQFIFGSEVKAILEYKDYIMDLDPEALVEYFTFQNLFTDRTLYKDIKLMPAGHYMTIDLKSFQMELEQYWDFNFIEPVHAKDENEYVEELDRLFRQAVKRQLVSDVEVGSYLSGGMDSGAITAIAAQEIPYLKTFTVGFDLHSASGLELAFDERERAEYMSYLYKTEHYEMVLKSGDMERCLPQFAWHLEEPRIGQSYPNYYASKLASKFVKVVLAGTGGDELFAGYPWRYYRAVVNESFDEYIDKYYQYWQRLIPNKAIHEVFSPVWDKVSQVWTRDIFHDVFKHHARELTEPEDYVNHSLYFEAKTFLHGLLVVEDKLSMAHSLETRVPFLDNDLVDFAMKVPVNMKLRGLKEMVRVNENSPGPKKKQYFKKTNDGKLILRKALKKYMPKDITSAVKQGFSSPDHSWFKGDSVEFVKEKLCDESARIYQFFDYLEVQKLLGMHFEGKENKRLFVWSLLNFSAWIDQYYDS